MIDYSNCVKVKDGVITREPVPEFLTNSQIPIDMISDLTWLSIPEFAGWGWWPISFEWPTLTRYQSYEAEVLSIDAARTVVVSNRAVRDWTAQEIHEWKQNTTRHITKLAFRNRFTAAEKIAFEMAQIDDPEASQTEREDAAALRVMEKDLEATPPPYVDLNDPFIQSMIGQRETLGLIAAGRADEIIWGDIEPNEMP